MFLPVIICREGGLAQNSSSRLRLSGAPVKGGWRTFISSQCVTPLLTHTFAHSLWGRSRVLWGCGLHFHLEASMGKNLLPRSLGCLIDCASLWPCDWGLCSLPAPDWSLLTALCQVRFSAGLLTSSSQQGDSAQPSRQSSHVLAMKWHLIVFVLFYQKAVTGHTYSQQEE